MSNYYGHFTEVHSHFTGAGLGRLVASVPDS